MQTRTAESAWKSKAVGVATLLVLGVVAAMAPAASATHTYVCLNGTPPSCANGPGAGVSHLELGSGDCDEPDGYYYSGQGVGAQTGATAVGRWHLWVGNGCYADAGYRETGLVVSVAGLQTPYGFVFVGVSWYEWTVGGETYCGMYLSYSTPAGSGNDSTSCPVGPPVVPTLP